MLYFFNVAGAEDGPDGQGVELAQMNDARMVAARHAGELLADRPDLAWAGEPLRVEVTDANRLILFTVMVLGTNAAAAAGR